MNNVTQSSMRAYSQLLIDYWKKVSNVDPVKKKSPRLGQYFINHYIQKPWPELYYEENYLVAARTIYEWLEDHCYHDELPEKLLP